MGRKKKTKNAEKQDGNEIRSLITALRHPSPDERHRAAVGAPPPSGHRDASGRPADRCPRVSDGDNDTRWYTGIALSRIGASAAAPLIRAMEENPDRDFRRYAAAALGGIGSPTVEPQIEAMKTRDRELRGFLSLALCRIGEPAVAPLSRRLSDPDEVLRKCAAPTLWPIGEAGLHSIIKDIHEEKGEKSGP